MTELTNKSIAELERMTVARLRERYREVFGEATASGNRQWLFRRIAWRLQALDEGGLSERARRRAAELARDADVRLRPPRIALVPPAGETTVVLTGRIRDPHPSAARGGPAPGTVLRRVHKGVEHVVRVLPSGFEYEGKPYRSLTAVATAITGSHWNGRLFFGLTKETA